MPAEKPSRRRPSGTEEDRPAEPAVPPKSRTRQAKAVAADQATEHRPGEGDAGNNAGATYPDLSHEASSRLRARLVRKYH